MGQSYYEIDKNFTPIFQTALALLRGRGCEDVCQIISEAKVSVINTEFDNWNGGTYGYTVYLNLSVKRYSSLLPEQITEMENLIAQTLSEVIKGDDSNYFIVQICPILSKDDINWESIGGQVGKKNLKENIDAIKNVMVSVATGGSRIPDEDERYKKLHSAILKNCKDLNIPYDNNFSSLWDWYGKWKSDLSTYQERRTYIKELFAPTFSYFEEDDVDFTVEPLVQLNDWERINRTVVKIKKESLVAKEEEDFQRIGLLCRDVIISLAQAVYNPLIHGSSDEKGTEIGKSDGVRMIGNYINSQLAGSSNKEIRSYAKTTNDLANQLTHKRSANKRDMMLTVSATIALINFIGIIEGKYS